MGYTHFWKLRKANLLVVRHCLKDMRVLAIAARARRDIKLDLEEIHTKMGERSFLTGIDLNGIGEEAHDTFVFPSHDGELAFCKTAKKPYDLVVTACLAVAKYHLKSSIEVTSDGQRKDWDAGVQFAYDTLGLTINNPIPEKK